VYYMAISYAWFDAFPDQITAEDYAEMPAELSRSIEVPRHADAGGTSGVRGRGDSHHARLPA
jgi:hypothetical protein